MDMTRPIVEMREITKTFGSTRALKGVDFTVAPGEVHALLGRNGAGKSTLVSALSGFTPADSGMIRIANVEIEANGRDYSSAIRDVIAHVQQKPQLFDLLTVAENLFVESGSVRNRFGLVSHRAMHDGASRLLQEWKMNIKPESLAGELKPGSRQLLEIVKALRRGVPVIILDEPTAALGASEKHILFEHVKSLKQSGVSFVYISHHLDEVFEVADNVTVLRDGQIVAARRPVADLDVQTLANLMMGSKTTRSVRFDHGDYNARPLLKATDILISPTSPVPINFEVRPGEIVALAGPVGGGKENLAMILAGQQKPFRGEITGNGGLPRIGFVPTDRHASGYVGMLGVRENIGLGGLDVLSGDLGFIDASHETSLVRDLVGKTDVIASSVEQAVGQLSGGNQQKVVFARALVRDPQVFIALSPTRGVDVGAKEQLYGLLRDLAARGLGVVVVSDEEDEINVLANRVVIIFDERATGELTGDYRMEDLILRMEGVA